MQCNNICCSLNYSFKEKPQGLDFPLLLVDEYISKLYFPYFENEKKNSMNGTSIGVVNSQKTKIWSGSNPSRPVYNICMYKVLFWLKYIRWLICTLVSIFLPTEGWLHSWSQGPIYMKISYSNLKNSTLWW